MVMEPSGTSATMGKLQCKIGLYVYEAQLILGSVYRSDKNDFLAAAIVFVM
jgi:hypothetical protein